MVFEQTNDHDNCFELHVLLFSLIHFFGQFSSTS